MVSPKSIWMGLSMKSTIPFLRATPISCPPIHVSLMSRQAGHQWQLTLELWHGLDRHGWRRRSDPGTAVPQWHAKELRTQIFRWWLQAWSWWILMEVDGSCEKKKNCQSSDAKKFPFPPDISLPYSAFEIIRSNTKISQDAQGQWIKIYHYWITKNSDSSTCFRLMKSYEEV